MLIPKLKAPLVLVHGLFGFNRIELAGFSVARYFPGVVECLQEAGNRVLVPSLSPTGGVAGRAEQLKNFILRAAPDEKVHLLAHSMGGLDSRYMITHLGMAERVLSLTTMGTPHRGSAFANWAVTNLEWLVKPTLQFLGIPIQGFYDLTVDACLQFNAKVPPAPGVKYFSVAGRHNGNILTPEWLFPYNIVLESEGPNDGVVSLASAQYGESMEVWEGDHFSLVNWPNSLGLTRSPGYKTDLLPRILGKLE